MFGLTSLDINNSVFNIMEENNKFKLYKFPDQKSVRVSYEKDRADIEKDLEISVITSTDLQDEIIAPIIIKENRENHEKNER